MDTLAPTSAISEAVAGRRLARAASLAREADAVARRAVTRASLRAPVHAIDVLLDDLERVNLAGGAATSAPVVAEWLRRVEDEVGAAAPAWVHDVPDTVRLHAAVLRWQGQLLDRCRPDRDGLGDMHEDPLDLLLIPNALGRFPLTPLPRPRSRVA